MKRLLTMLVTTTLAASLLTATAEARGGAGHMGGFGGGHMRGFGGSVHMGAIGGTHMGGFGGGRIGPANHVGAYGWGLHHDSMHRFGGVWPRYGAIFDNGLDCYDLYYGRPRNLWPPYCG
ncbi:hypothetical protein [Bradyrhizobium canariense]|uniref:Sulfur globule protein n=1 Tax=Bradyrhizobium canariense TaxID=255045 RepID=A0A1X3GSF0_9BRAD|nr:hypothetical protein [Bradyrhizobium canariense]OSI76557.1 hypothetical protein BSZ22_04625 [Bradyrhizobium canariense]OSI81906.1 hypothetical protein BSZ23_04330 [Bradyrhizobium canariense]OSI89998.1 hypothetical protein BSZ25_19705 [Bradyrhizobium canariense]OSI96517.1 hypothetical protein BSZ24_04300 [Bradyrhizobium canariense]OSJ01850.1 hypothetical protein BSZ18_39340 [Bradyrhizobium canariense]